MLQWPQQANNSSILTIRTEKAFLKRNIFRKLWIISVSKLGSLLKTLFKSSLETIKKNQLEFSKKTWKDLGIEIFSLLERIRLLQKHKNWINISLLPFTQGALSTHSVNGLDSRRSTIGEINQKLCTLSSSSIWRELNSSIFSISKLILSNGRSKPETWHC